MLFKDRDGAERTVRLIKMNCVDFKHICYEKGIDAYPMLRLYKADGTFSLFEGKRDKDELTRWLERTVKMKSYGWASNHEVFERGCNVKGHVSVPRVPGALELMAGGNEQALNPSMTNVSHLVKHFAFSDPDHGKDHRRMFSMLPKELRKHTTPLDGRNYVTQQFHQVWTHDFKVVGSVNSKNQMVYQFTHQHRLSIVEKTVVPQARFHFDIEPFAILISKDEKKWYDFVTSMMAMLGGVFAMMRLMSIFSTGIFGLLRRSTATRITGGGHLDVGHMD